MTRKPQLPSNVDEKDLEATFANSFSYVPDGSSSSNDAFRDYVHKWLAEWVKRQFEFAEDINHAASKLSPAIFVFVEWPQDIIHAGDVTLIEDFFCKTSTDISGKIIFANANLRSAYYSKTPIKTTEQGAILLSGLGLQNAPCIIFKPAEEFKIAWSPDGISTSPSNITHLPIKGLDKVSKEELDEVLKDFHKRNTEFPNGTAMVWDSATKRIVIRNCEASIRDSLHRHLRDRVFASNAKLILREYELENGRVDIWIAPSVVRPHTGACLIELKVLRSRPFSGSSSNNATYSSNTNERWARRGVNQAARYKAIDNADLGYTCCFDARDDDNELPDIVKLANEKDVCFRRYFMYSSTDSAS